MALRLSLHRLWLPLAVHQLIGGLFYTRPHLLTHPKLFKTMPRLYNLVNNEELKRRMYESDEPRITFSFYQYWNIDDPQAFRDQAFREWIALGVWGRVYVAKEGINAQVSVPESNFDSFRNLLYSVPALKGIRLNIAVDDNGKSFYKLKMKVRSKIVADGLDDDSFDVTRRGHALSALEFNELTADPDTIIVDMRNHYESEVGHFQNAILPEVVTFREALPQVENMLEDKKNRNIIMYCTGGIRCEKASAYMLHKGFNNVFMVEGGIIEYARQCQQLGLPNKFIGKNFVFDERLGERISSEVIAKCHQCGQPSDHHTNCANDACHLLFIQCPACAEKFHQCCSTKCADFSQLPEDQRESLKPISTFNGSKFTKGRYKAFHTGAQLTMD
jgi:UPF0176 protein